MFADPQSITINSVAKSLPRINIGDMKAIYRSADDVWEMVISHQSTKGRKRHMVSIQQTVVAADPLTAENTSQKARVYIVFDEPTFGFSDTDLGYIGTGLAAWLAASGAQAKVLASES